MTKKICLHRSSEAYKTAVSVLQSREEQRLKAAVANQKQQQHEETCRVFRTAYYIAKSDRPYNDHPALIELQQPNDVNVGRILHSNVIYSDIIDHVAVEMRCVVMKRIIANNVPCAVLIDESTSLSHTSCLIVYDRVGPVTIFPDVIELHSTTVEGVEQALCVKYNIVVSCDLFSFVSMRSEQFSIGLLACYL